MLDIPSFSALAFTIHPGDGVTKSELIEKVAQETGLTKGRAEMVINAIFDSMTEALVRNEGIEIRGFGSFTVRQYKAYEGRNPRTGDPVHVAPKRLPFFKVGKELRERVNGNGDGEGAGQKAPAGPRQGGNGNKKPTPPGRGRDENLSEDVI